MINLKRATFLVRKYIEKLESDDGIELELLPEPICENEVAWAFEYQNAKFLRSGRFSDRLLGNGPIIVSRDTGQISEAGTAHPTEYYLELCRLGELG